METEEEQRQREVKEATERLNAEDAARAQASAEKHAQMRLKRRPAPPGLDEQG